MASSIIKGVDEQGARSRGERRATQAQVVSTDTLSHTAVLDIGETDATGAPRYLADIAYQPQSPPSPGDHVSIGYGNLSSQSAVVTGSQLGATNDQSSLQVDGATVLVEVSAGAPVGPRQTLNLIPGANISSITAADNPPDNRIDITINASGGGGGSPHALLDASQDSDTVAHAPTAGDLIYANATPKWTGLGIGTTGEVLTVVSGAPAWAAAGGGGGAWTEQSIAGATTLTGTGPTVAICDNSSSAYTVSIPSGAGFAGNLFVIKRTVINSNQITIQVLSGGTLEGSGTLNLGAFQAAYGVQFESVILESNGTEYKIVGVVPVTTGGQQGPITWNTTYTTANYTVAGTDVGVSADSTSGAITITLPAPTAANVGRVIKVVRAVTAGTHNVTCDATTSVGTEFNRGAASVVIGPTGSSGNFAEFICTDEAGTYTWRAYAFG